jgi:hypothetical protein
MGEIRELREKKLPQRPQRPQLPYHAGCWLVRNSGGEVNQIALTLNLVEEKLFIIHLNKIKITR